MLLLPVPENTLSQCGWVPSVRIIATGMFPFGLLFCAPSASIVAGIIIFLESFFLSTDVLLDLSRMSLLDYPRPSSDTQGTSGSFQNSRNPSPGRFKSLSASSLWMRR